MIDLDWTRPLLRPEHGGRSLKPQQGIGHVAGQDERRGTQALVEAGKIKMVQLHELSATGTQIAAPAVRKAGAEGLEHPCTTVGRRAPPEREDDSVAPPVQSCQDELPDTVSGGGERVPAGDMQACGLGQLDHSPPVSDGQGCLHRPSVRPGDLYPLTSVSGRHHYLGRPLATVSHRTASHEVSRCPRTDACAQGGAGILGRERRPKLVQAYQDLGQRRGHHLGGPVEARSTSSGRGSVITTSLPPPPPILSSRSRTPVRPISNSGIFTVVSAGLT
jgi:hypothetical protein